MTLSEFLVRLDALERRDPAPPLFLGKGGEVDHLLSAMGEFKPDIRREFGERLNVVVRRAKAERDL
jgi:hypothetical protein